MYYSAWHRDAGECLHEHPTSVEAMECMKERMLPAWTCPSCGGIQNKKTRPKSCLVYKCSLYCKGKHCHDHNAHTCAWMSVKPKMLDETAHSVHVIDGNKGSARTMTVDEIREMLAQAKMAT